MPTSGGATIRRSVLLGADFYEANGDGYYIRGGVIIVPRDGVIKPGVTV